MDMGSPSFLFIVVYPVLASDPSVHSTLADMLISWEMTGIDSDAGRRLDDWLKPFDIGIVMK